MSKITNCTFQIPGQKRFYYAGETVEGTVSFTVQKEVPVIGVYIALRGVALTKWFDFSKGSDIIAKEVYINKRFVLLGGDNKKHILTTGEKKFKFKIPTPSHSLPSAFEGSNGAIRYWLEIEITRPFPYTNFKWYRSITISSKIPVNTPNYRLPVSGHSEKTISKIIGLGNAGNVYLTATIDRSAYCPGEFMLLDIVAKNDSTKDVEVVTASLIQNAIFISGHETESTRTVIHKVQSAKLVKGREEIWNQYPFPVHAVPPTTAQNSCHIIKVSYELEVVVQVPMGIDLVLKLPVIIGTIPFYRGGDPNTNLRKPKFCTHGIGKFTSSDGIFISMNYRPMTMFVENYSVPSRSAPIPKPAGATPKPLPVEAATVKNSKEDIARQYENTGVTQSALSAPRMESPPSYEETMALSASPASNVNENSSASRQGNGVILLMTFPRQQSRSLRKILKQNLMHLQTNHGQLLSYSVSPCVKVSNGAFWSDDWSCALFYFWTSAEAKLWVVGLSTENDELAHEWAALVAPNYKSGLPDLNPEYKAITLNIVKEKYRVDEEAFTDYVSCYSKVFLPKQKALQKKVKCRKFLVSSSVEFLFGDWTSVFSEQPKEAEVVDGHDEYSVGVDENAAIVASSQEPTEAFLSEDVGCHGSAADEDKTVEGGEIAQDDDVMKFKAIAYGYPDLETARLHKDIMKEDPELDEFRAKFDRIYTRFIEFSFPGLGLDI